jgi:crotonobetainyl-CoA:carnitine CoA-transferase CaiB-like acyl-CoA transferase
MVTTVDGLPAVRSPITISGTDLSADRPSPRHDEHGAGIRHEISGKQL